MLFGTKVLQLAAAINVITTLALAASIPDNAVAQYWGQNSAASSGDGSQKNLAYYCDDATDVLILSFLTDFNVGGLPTLNFASACTETFSGTNLLNCPNIAQDIKTCQDKGKIILLSLGGAAGSYSLSSDNDAKTFAHSLHGMFGKGTNKYRPFGDAVVDGFDLDIEGGGSTGYATLVNTLKSLDSELLITGAPQCPFPDAMLGDALDNAEFDAVFVQFYNNYCQGTGSNFNFDAWDSWATSTSPNKDVKVFLGLPGSSSAAGSGYLPFTQVASILAKLGPYSSFGGVMFWDASQTSSNTAQLPNLASAVADLLHTGSSGSGSSPTTTDSPSHTTTTADTHHHTTTATSASDTQTAQSSDTSTQSPSDTGNPKHASTPTTTSASSPSPSSGGTSCGGSIKPGDACSSEGQFACTGTSFATCDHGAWVVTPCGSGLTCFRTTDDSSIYCAQPSSSSGLPGACPNNFVAPQAYVTSMVRAHLSVTSATTTSWSAVVNARRTKAKPFGSKVVVTMKVPDGMVVNDVISGGKVTQSGSVATLQINNPRRKSMDIVFTIHGTIGKNGVFMAPSTSGMSFQ
ncbi:glycoside hydrolase [Hesseltinella vesiculosa]|uniref:chitinase n=1 Tax=Hesseltinella vesiculosa TaxID=101127 RepID=A0A1X2G6T0_9FUNG|nr:glycoside hydrolase [Hesseltinella vesiculosa]